MRKRTGYIKDSVANFAAKTGFLDIYAFARKKLVGPQLAILLYHSICPNDGNWFGSEVSPTNFNIQMEYFSRKYEILSLNDLVVKFKQPKSLPANAVVITFDDGYKNNYVYAYPILKKYSMPATIFVTTGNIGNGQMFWWDKVAYVLDHTTASHIQLDEIGDFILKSKFDRQNARSSIVEKLKTLSEKQKNLMVSKLLYLANTTIPHNMGNELRLSWEEIKEMSNQRITFGAHSVSHAILTRVSPEQAKYEILQSKKDIEENTKLRVTAFSYPNGDYEPMLVKFVKDSGFECAFSVKPNKLINPKDNIYTLGRLGAVDNLNKFKVELCGIWGDLQQFLGQKVN